MYLTNKLYLSYIHYNFGRKHKETKQPKKQKQEKIIIEKEMET